MISIIVPVFNAEKSMERCIDSILKQNYSDIEVILIDDGSNDRSGEIGLQYTKHDKRVKYFYQENKGAASARNYGICKALGEWIQFVDADDYVDESISGKMLEAAYKNAVDWVICGMKTVSARGEKINTFGSHVCRNKEDMGEVISSNYSKAIMHSCCNKLYKRSLIKEFMRIDYVYGEDYIFNLGYFQNISSFCVIEDPLYIYDCTKESITRGRCKNRTEAIKEQYQLSCELLVSVVQSEKLHSIVTVHFVKEFLKNCVKDEKIYRINAQLVKSVLQEYERQLQDISADDAFSKALSSLHYNKVASILRRNRYLSNIRSMAKMICEVVVHNER